MRSSHRGIALFLCSAIACDAPTAPLPPGAISFEAPEVYAWWWSATEACSGLRGSLRSVSWYVVPGAQSIPSADGRPVAGMWYRQSNRIVLAEEARYFGDLVRHEMLHALLQGGDHPREQFVQRCAAEVVCVDACLEESGSAPPPDPSAIHAAATALAITVQVVPSVPQSAIHGGHFMMIISAANHSSQALLIDLPPSGDAGPPGTFGYNIVDVGAGRSQQYDIRAEVPEVTRFAPGEVKRFLFDLRNRDGSTRYDLAPGTWRFEGRYGDVWASSPPTVSVLP